MLTWDDWDREPYPLNFVQGTLLAKVDKMPLYPEQARGEDTGLCLRILEAGHRIARLRHHGWCYIYTYHGNNVWSEQHLRAISAAKHMPLAFLAGQMMTLRKHLTQYEGLPPYLRITAGHTAIDLDNNRTAEIAA